MDIWYCVKITYSKLENPSNNCVDQSLCEGHLLAVAGDCYWNEGGVEGVPNGPTGPLKINTSSIILVSIIFTELLKDTPGVLQVSTYTDSLAPEK